MTRSPPVLLVLLLARALISPGAFAQQTDSAALPGVQAPASEVRGVALEQNFPNPFSTETRIPFVLGEDLFEDDRPVVVSVRVFNVLRQLVAIPTAVDHPVMPGRRALELQYDQPGRYMLLWDGRDSGGEPVSSGIYFCQIVADGSSSVRKMIVIR